MLGLTFNNIKMLMRKKFERAGLSLILMICFGGFIHLKSQVFNEVSSSLGVASVTLSEYGSGISLYDWNVDGYDDIVLLNYDSFPRFFLNTGGSFEEVFFPDLQFTANFTSVCWIDIENDGDLDIAFNTQFNGFFLFENDGNFNFQDITEEAGILPQLSDAYTHSWADYNRDGFIDLYLPYYEDGVNGENPSRNILYKNNGDGTFSNVTGLAGVDDGYRKSLITVWFDYNNDLWPDLFVLNDRFFFDNHLYRNNGDGTFTDVSEEAGVLLGIESMSGTVGDMNNDGFLDVFITNSASGSALLHLNRGNGTFSESSADYNVQLFQGGWAGVWIDYDNDMLQDLFVCTQPPPGDNYLFRNLETTLEIDNNSGLFGQSSTYAAALCDINNDGAPDLVSFSRAPDGIQIWQNTGTENNYLKIKLQGVETNREAIGSWIDIITPDGTHQYRHTLCGENFLAQNSQWMQIGMGENLQADTIRIRWLSGLVEEYYDVPVNQNLIFVEGGSFQNQITFVGSPEVCEGDSILLDAGTWDSYLWSTGDTTSTIYGFAGETYAVTTSQGSYTIVADSLTVSLESKPDIFADITPVSCFSESDAKIELSIQPSPQSVYWPALEQVATEINHLPAGSYAFEIESSLGCVYKDSISIENPEEIILNTFLLPEEESAFCQEGTPVEIIFTGDQGVVSASWFLYQSFAQPPIAGGFFEEGNTCVQNSDPNNILVVSIIDDANCIALDTIRISELVVSISHPQLTNGGKIYPNPANNELYVEINKQDARIEIVSALGKVIELDFTPVNPYLRRYNLKNLKAGSYVVIIYSEGFSNSYSFLKE